MAPPDLFDGADSIVPDHPRSHGQTSLPVPPAIVPFLAKQIPTCD
ncbi:MAG: hypothetical protein O8C66_14325 [Candidatus Methanoperedens sp.]|nr:hypothetical protein [Candidatus Methanoperedens sp.]